MAKLVIDKLNGRFLTVIVDENDTLEVIGEFKTTTYFGSDMKTAAGIGGVIWSEDTYRIEWKHKED